MLELGARCVALSDPVIEKPVGILTKPGHELSVAAQAIADALRADTGYPAGCERVVIDGQNLH
jgi:LysR family carnitine catabolism transcriptional activator